jgi:hypothetical protein
MSRFSRWSAVLALTACLTPAVAGADDPSVQRTELRYDPRFILETVARQMGVTLRAEEPLPAVFLASTTPLRQFQDAIEAQWRFRPDTIVNTYAVAQNQIYLYDGASYYAAHHRTLDDSLAHEFVHYVQARYKNEDLSSDWSETEAVTIQKWFREVYVERQREVLTQQDASPAPLGVASAELPTRVSASACVAVRAGADGRAIRCLTAFRPTPG